MVVTCPKCNKDSRDNGKLKRHLDAVKACDVESVKHCQQCNKTFASVTHYKIHAECVHGLKFADREATIIIQDNENVEVDRSSGKTVNTAETINNIGTVNIVENNLTEINNIESVGTFATVNNFHIHLTCPSETVVDVDEYLKTHSTHVYLLREREFIALDLPIYKLGKTRQLPNKRFANYPKNSKLHVCHDSADCDADERYLLSLFNLKFKRRSDIGTEYFEGNVEHMKKLMYQYFIELIDKQ